MTPEQIQQLRQQYGYNPETLNLSSQGGGDVQSDEVNKRLQTVFGGTQEIKPEEGILTRLAKDAASTLVVRPVSRTTEAVTRTFFPDSMAAKGYESYADTNQPVQTGVFGIEVAQPGTGTQAVRNIAGETAQSAAYLFPYGKAAGALAPVAGKTLGAMASGAAGGYMADIGQGLTDQNQTVGEALTPGLGTAIGGAIPAAPAILQGTGRLTSKAGSKLIEAVTPTSAKEAQILQGYKAENPFFTRVANVLTGTEKAPQTAAKTITETTAGQTLPGLFGTKSQIGVQAKRASQTLWKDLIEPRLKNAGVQVDLPKYFDTVEQSIINSTDDITRQNSLKEALNAIREDYAGVNSIDLAKLQKLKEGWAEFVPEKFYKGQNIAGNVRQVQALLADEARQTIYNTLGNDVKQAYLDYGNLLGIQELGQSAMTGQKLKGGAGSFLSELLSEAVTPIGTVGGQVLYRTGKGLEMVGNAGAKILGDVLGVENKMAQELKAPIKTQATQTASNATKNVIMKDTIPQSTKGASGKMSGFAQVTKDIPKELQPLAEEARKYKSAEEFIKAQGGIGDSIGQAVRKQIELNKITDELSKKANSFSGKGGLVEDLKNPEFIKIKKELDAKMTELRSFNSSPLGKLVQEEYSKQKDFNLRKKLRTGDFYTKSELIDLWNKANRNTKGGFAELGFLPKAAIGTAVGTGALKAGVEYKKSKNK